MHLEHVAIWTPDLERLRAFYEQHFAARAGARYESRTHPGFSSYFLEFTGGGARLEIMTFPVLHAAMPHPAMGYAHLALRIGTEDEVIAYTERLREAGVPVISEPRRTGDGYFEAVVTDPDGNRIEITA